MWIRDPGWKKFGSGIWNRKKSDLGFGDKHSGSATLPLTVCFFMCSRRYNEESDAVVDSTVDSTTSGGGGYFTVPSPPPHPAQANEAAHEGDNTEDEEEGADTDRAADPVPHGSALFFEAESGYGSTLD